MVNIFDKFFFEELMTEEEIALKAMQLTRRWHAREFRNVGTNEQLKQLFPLFQEAWRLGLVQNNKLSASNFTAAIGAQWFANNPTSNVDHDGILLYESIITVWSAWAYMAERQ
jgi:hypothetical protein